MIHTVYMIHTVVHRMTRTEGPGNEIFLVFIFVEEETVDDD